ncbi:BirA family transcriptional regulator, biotin operon repressor / biotin-[acetyl-CoA-carboxylase] ligase [Sporobacter termitidis DSM 10068]|uniref:Bifunctional ligase/repressor BirA n=1 Tax=Sporobacter termitidis DSM 10068 TaxID=1123282 RepID=A0A1M5TX19_9FIRM|nr:biotin--[acetyl-CoA-carboxylase] ligase [Sporobacter termitidis]SHH55244.1 BirA family transcriptional regulator, biotin operon repressor / biotin-[acetyl-CoA-carboxylase] ligase [Sporobacter termitidis DSM 10068]
MDLKDQVLETLENNKGGYVSGNELADKLFVSRNAVWKAVKALQEDGHHISAVTNKGYCLGNDSDILSKASIEKHLGQLGGQFNVEVRKTLTSTNTVLKEKAASGAPEGTVVVAEVQTGGRGRLGRNFYSPGGTGIYFSVLLRPKGRAEEVTMITAAAAVAVAEAIEAVTGVGAGIKWVNDVYCRGKKVCGILTEGAFDFESGGMEYAVLGIGVNVTAPDSGFPEDIADKVGAVYEGAAPAAEARSRLIAEILTRFAAFYESLSGKRFIGAYQARSFVVGRDVDVIAGDTVRRARALRVDDDCRLVVRYEDDTVEALSSGEVSIRPYSA